MKGGELCDFLRTVANARTDAELARAIGFSSARVAQLRSSNAIKPGYAAKLVEKIVKSQVLTQLKESIKPIVEFFPIERSRVRVQGHGRYIPFDAKRKSGRELVSKLKNAHGIYAFYNSQGEIIYIGKTEGQPLYERLTQSYNTKSKARLFRVRHPSALYRSRNNNQLRRIRKEEVKISDVASYFSAYSAANSLIGKLEALLIRMVPNDLINTKIQKSELEAFPLPEL